MVSVIIPVYNSEKYLNSCIDCITKQTYKDLQIILVDDASTDSSGEICDNLAANDSRIQVIHHEYNKGLSLSKYDGYQEAKGEWISFVDNDDLIIYTMYENLIDLSNIYKDADILCIYGSDVNGSNIDLQFQTLNKQDSCQNPTINDDKVMVCDNMMACQTLYGETTDKKKISGIFSATWGKIIRRSLFEKALSKTINYKDKLYWIFLEDVLFIPICMHVAQKVVFLEDVKYLHRMSEANLSARLIPSEYHYETVEAGAVIQDYYRSNDMKEIADYMLESFLLNIQSVYYKVYKYEVDTDKRVKGIERIVDLWNKYFKEYKRCNTKYKSALAKISIYFFNNNKILWLITVGNIHFKKLK